MANYLITGMAGFIGSSLAHALVERGHSVRGVDNLSTGKLENLADIRDQVDFREADLLDLDAMKDACRDMDFVLHQAAIPSVPRSVKDPIDIQQIERRRHPESSCCRPRRQGEARYLRFVFVALWRHADVCPSTKG